MKRDPSPFAWQGYAKPAADASRKRPTVVKIGGSLLTSADSLRRVAVTLAARWRQGERLVVVTSAFQGITDLLEQSLWPSDVTDFDDSTATDPGSQLRLRHQSLARDLGVVEVVGSELGGLLDEAQRLLEAGRRDRLNRPTQARLLSYGERLSAPLVAAALRDAGAEARSWNSEEAGLRAAGPGLSGVCDLEGSRRAMARLTDDSENRIPVLTGFYGVHESGAVVLFGRGGSDYTASAISALLGASRLELWKDVPGFFTANPKRVPGAHLVPELSFDEAAELGRYGARILHPLCLEPLRGLGLRVTVGSPDAAEARSTILTETTGRARPRVAALAVRAPRSVVRVADTANPAARREVGRVLADLRRQGFPLDGVRASGAALSFSIVDDRPHDVSQMLCRLGQGSERGISVRQTPARVGLIGEEAASDPAISSRLSESLAALSLRSAAVTIGPGRLVLRCWAERDELVPLLAALHERFFPVVSSLRKSASN